MVATGTPTLWNNMWAMMLVETAETISNPPHIPQSQIRLPNRRVTAAELEEWKADYNAIGGANSFEEEVLRLTNLERANVGAPPLVMNSNLMMSARFKAQKMADIGYFGHNSPVYGHFANISRELFNVEIRSEILAIWQRTPQEVVDAWMASSTHRAALLNPEFTEVGIGFFRFRWTQKFA